MLENKSSAYFWVALLLIWAFFRFNGDPVTEPNWATGYKKAWEYQRAENDELRYRLRTTQNALEQANQNIEYARSYAGESYDDMYAVLDSLETVEP